MTIRLGVIGLSAGNGHPYSWSAIFNGYDPQAMENCGFPAIPRYLEAQEWPAASIGGAQVTGVWTQEKRISEHIAKAAFIPHVCESVQELVEQSDAILLARDDAENHWQFAEPVLRAGKPIYIDKPAALRVQDMKKLYDAERYPGQIFTCSALRYAKELELDCSMSASIGDVRSVVAITPKSWAKYGIHIIEPALKLLPESDTPVVLSTLGPAKDGASSLLVRSANGIDLALHAVGNTPVGIRMQVNGRKATLDLEFCDSFNAFKTALMDFIDGLKREAVSSPQAFNYRAIHLLEAGLKP